MYRKNDGSDVVNILQNQFTAYLSTAVHNARVRYIKNRIKRYQRELSMEEHEFLLIQDFDYPDLQAENEILINALNKIKEKELYVLLAHVIEEKNFKVIAAELGIGYKGAAAIYYRTIAKLKNLIRGETNEF